MSNEGASAFNRFERALAAAREITRRPHGRWIEVSEADALRGGEILDFIDLTNPDRPVMGQCWPTQDGLWSQAPRGDYVILAWEGEER